MTTTVYTMAGGKAGNGCRVAVRGNAREYRRERATVQAWRRRNGLALDPVPIYTITEAMCQVKARTAYCAARRAGADANAAFEATLAEWRPLIGTPTDAFFQDHEEAAQ